MRLNAGTASTVSYYLRVLQYQEVEGGSPVTVRKISTTGTSSTNALVKYLDYCTVNHSSYCTMSTVLKDTKRKTRRKHVVFVADGVLIFRP